MANLKQVLLAIRHGNLLEQIASFEDDQLKPFLPFLVQIGFSNNAPDSSELDPIRNRLIDIPLCNDLYKYSSLDYSEIETQCIELAGKAANEMKKDRRLFVTMSPMERVLHICAHLIWTKEYTTREQLNFVPFDMGGEYPPLQEEIGWILALLSMNCPQLFPPNELAKQLLNYELAPAFINTIVMNQPDILEAVLDPLVLLLKQPDDESFMINQAKITVFNLFQLEPLLAQQYIGLLMDNEKGARRTIQMLCTDSIDAQFFVDNLIAQFSNRENSEVVAFLTKAVNKPLMKSVCQRLGMIMEQCRRCDGSDLEGRVVLLISLLASCASLRLTTDESRQWVSFLTRETITDDISLKISLATILASPNLMQDQISFRDEQIGRSLGAFFSRLHSLIQAPEYSLLSNVMILIYVHLITDNADEMASLLSSILGHKVPKTLAKQPFVRELYIQHAINQHDVVQKAANINITKGLDANKAGYLPVHCICAMLHWRKFSKYSTPIQEWVKAQMIECHSPIHPMVAHLLENFTNSCIPSETFPHFNQPISEQFFQEIFSGDIFDESRLVIRIISLAYLVAFRYKLDVAQLPKDQLGANKAPQPYSQALWKIIPIRYLMIMADARHEQFEHIRPMLQRFMVMSMPHLLPEQMHFNIFESISSIAAHGSRVNPVAFSSALDEAISKHNFYRFASMLNTIEGQSIRQQFLHYDTILRTMVHSLDEYWPRSLLNKITKIWERFDTVIPRKLHEDTIRLWLKTPLASSVSGLDERDNDFLIGHTPLVLFRADKRVFKSPAHLRCFCRLLAFYMAISRDYNYLRLARAQPYNVKVEMEEKEALLRSFIGTQRLAVVQVFIELCDGDPAVIPDLEEIREILCTQIHQYFIADTQLPKLVNFNMYPIRLIPLIVQKVPSAHILINSINELVTGGSLERRIFAVILVTELLKQYKIPGAFAALTLISDLLDTLISNTVDQEFIVLMLNITEALGQLTLMSPFHAEHFLATMARTRTVAQNRLALYTSFTEARNSPEQKLIDLLNKTLDDLPKLEEGRGKTG